VRGRHSDRQFRVAVAFLVIAGPAWAIGPGQSDNSGEVLITALAFPVITVAASATAVAIGRRAGRSPSMLRAILGALVGLILTTAFGLALLARTPRDLAFFATSIFTLAAIPTGLIGLVVGGLATLLDRHPPKR
jgi:drug/metabolite transporter (DMT)-like permease